jgi:hypothetical protein
VHGSGMIRRHVELKTMLICSGPARRISSSQLYRLGKEGTKSMAIGAAAPS